MWPQGLAPQFWALVSTVLAAFGVAYVPSDAVKAVIGAAAGLVLAVYQWQHHRTVRHALTTTAAVAGQKLDVKIAEANAAAAAHLAAATTPAPAAPDPLPSPAPVPTSQPPATPGRVIF